MGKFTDRLWRELVQAHGDELAKIKRPAGKRGRMARPQLLAGTFVGLAGVGTAVALVFATAGTTPAFAVSTGHDGFVRVRIFRADGIAGANAKLAAMGVRAQVVPVSANCPKAQSIQTAPPSRQRAQVEIDAHKIAAGRTLVVTFWREGAQVDIARANEVSGAVPNCLPPAPPPGCSFASGSSGSSGNSGNTGNTGNSGNSGNTGNSGNSGSSSSSSSSSSSGNTGNTGNQRLPRTQQVPANCQVPAPGPPGSSGNSGTSGNS